MFFNLFKKNPKEKEASSSYLTLKVREVVRETPYAVTIYFDQPEPHLDYKPGQFLTVILDINGKEERRSYSLCTSPFVDPFPGITVKRLDGGLVSTYLSEQVVPGKKITVMKPMGNFVSDYHSKHKRHYGMIVAGSGITPIMSITKSILINEPQSKVSILYGSRSEDQIIFSEMLDQLIKTYPDRIEIIHQLSKPSGNWTGPRGRIFGEHIRLFAERLLLSKEYESRFFLCGPNKLMDVSRGVLSELGIQKEHVFSENFYLEPTKDEPKEAEEISPVSREVTVVIEGNEFTFDVVPGKTILEAGLEEDIDMPYSCQSGLCTACRGRLLSGEVSMIEDAGLSENEIAQGYILCCSSKPKSGNIKISIE